MWRKMPNVVRRTGRVDGVVKGARGECFARDLSGALGDFYVRDPRILRLTWDMQLHAHTHTHSLSHTPRGAR